MNRRRFCGRTMNEVEIRKAIIEKILRTKYGQRATFLPEMFIDSFSRRADLVVANGNLAAFEIKSRRDNLDRLSGQIETYRRHFEYATVVCAKNHLAGVEAIVPDDVGIWTVNDKGAITVVRRPRKVETSKVDWLSFLPVDELRQLLRANSLPTSGLRSTLIGRASDLSIKRIRRYAIDYLKRRHLRVQKIIEKRGAQNQLMATSRIEPPTITENPIVPAIPRKKAN